MKFSEKIDKFTDEQKQKFFSMLALELVQYFDESNTKDKDVLQTQFRRWQIADIREYRLTLDYVLAEIIDELYEMEVLEENITLTWRDLGFLPMTKWRVCEVCGQPFIDISRNGKAKCCYHYKYEKNYSLKRQTYFKTNKSNCQMVARRKYMKRYRKK